MTNRREAVLLVVHPEVRPAAVLLGEAPASPVVACLVVASACLVVARPVKVPDRFEVARLAVVPVASAQGPSLA